MGIAEGVCIARGSVLHEGSCCMTASVAEGLCSTRVCIARGRLLHEGVHCTRMHCTRVFYCNDRGLTAVPEGLPPGATTLFLQNNRIGDAGIPPRLGRLPALRVLYLYANALEQLPRALAGPQRPGGA
uniref:Uncharacterized protein n=1 Tax=Anser cygnoides TaxID=8845 RepID=A0A8B9EJV7_ANSCY